MKPCRRPGKGLYFALFGAGLLVCQLLPLKMTVAILGVALVVCGISCAKH